MQERSYRDPLNPREREEFEKDLIAFCDGELDMLGDIRGLNVLYAGGSSLLWIEGLSQRIGEEGTLTALDIDVERIDETRGKLQEADLAAPVRLVVGNVLHPPFEAKTFDLVYSSGLFHELDVREHGAGSALAALANVVRPGGRIATSDFVDSMPAVQLEDEEIQREAARVMTRTELYGIGAPERLVALHESVLEGVRSRVSPPFEVRHLDKVVLTEGEDDVGRLRAVSPKDLRRRRENFLKRVRREGYSRPATIYVEGFVAGG